MTEQQRREEEMARSMENATNSPVLDPKSDAGREALNRYAERLDHLLDERAAINEDIKELKKEVADNGFNAPYMTKAVMAKRKREAADKDEFAIRQAEIEIYFDTILGDTTVQP